MPNRWPISSGNWSNSAIWSGSIIPTASDDVYANNQTVTIDQDITVTSLRNSATTGVTAGGRFVIVDNYTINSTTIAGSSVASLVYTGSNGANINGNIVQGAVLNFTPSLQLSGTAGTINISGSLSNLSGANFHTIAVTTANQIVNFTGSIIATAADNRNRVFNITSGPNTYNILGNITSSGATVFACNVNIININITGSTLASNVTHIINTPGATSVINVSGSITGPFLSTTALHATRINGNILSNLSTTCISDSSTGSIFITGSLTSTLSPVITCTGAGRVEVSGSLTAINTPVISSTNTSATNLFTGPFYNTNNRNAIFAPNIQLLSGSTPTWTFYTETFGEQRTLYTTDYPGNFPSITDVRDGVVFGDINQFTGTVAIPPTGSVLKGVPVDNTTGSASFDTQSVWGVDTNLLTTTGSLGARLKNAATVATTGDAIASKGNL